MSQSRIKKKQAQQTPKVAAPVVDDKSIDQEPPLFSLRYLSKDYGLDQCNKDEKAALISKLARLSQMSWNEIRSAPRHGMGYEKIARSSLKVPVPASVPEDANIIAFRFFGMAPMLGFKDRAVFYIIWLDCKFNVYSHD